MDKVVSFEDVKKRGKVTKKQAPLVNQPTEELKAKKHKELHNRAMNYIAWINSVDPHKFSYPTLASRFPKNTHSIDVLQGHCFTNWGGIQNDMKSIPGIAFAKKMAYERREEIIEFLNWRLSKYQESKALYGKDLVIIDIHIEITEILLKLFKELFLTYVRT